MKKLHLQIITIFIAFLNFGYIYGQDSVANFYTTKQQMNAYYDSVTEVIGLDSLIKLESTYGVYKSWVNTWEPRLSGHGDFSIYDKALRSFIQTWSKGNCKNGNWVEDGPANQPSEGGGYCFGQAGSPAGGTGLLDFIAFDPQVSSTIVVGASAGGLFYSTNSGTSFSNAGTDAGLPFLGVSDCAIDPTNSNTWFIGTGDREAQFDGSHEYGYNVSSRIYRKTGVTFNWLLIGDAAKLGALDGLVVKPGWHIKKLLIDPNDHNVIYAATSFGIYKTTNALAVPATDVLCTKLIGTGGANDDRSFYDIEFKPTNSQTIYAASDFDINGTQANIIMTSDGGANWATLTAGITDLSLVRRFSLVVTSDLSDMLYALSATNHGTPHSSRVFAINTVTETSWTDRGLIPVGYYGVGVYPSHINSFCIGPSATLNNETFWAGDAYPIEKSINGGSSWSSVNSSGYHNDIHHIRYDANGNLWVAHDGGLSKYDGTTWTFQNDGIGIADINLISSSSINTDYILEGGEHCGTNLYDGTIWKHVVGGDSYKPAFDFTNLLYMYGCAQSGFICRSDNMGSDFSHSAYGATGSNTYTYYELNTANPSTYFQVGTDIWRTTNKGAAGSWNKISDFSAIPYSMTSYTMWKVYTVENRPDYVYAHVLDYSISAPYATSRLFKTTIGNSTDINSIKTSWVEIPLPFNGVCTWLNDITFDEEDPDIIWVEFGGTNYNNGNCIINNQKVYKYDGYSGIWTNITGNLPDLGTGTIVHESGSDDGLYVGNQNNIYYTNNKYMVSNPTSYWRCFSANLPNVDVSDLVINYTDNKIRAGTFGRGVWQSTLYCPPNIGTTSSSSDLTLSASIASQNIYYEAYDQIFSTGSITGVSDVHYRAGSDITLSPGFIVTASGASRFAAFIHPCDKPGNSFRLENNPITNDTNSHHEEIIPYLGLRVFPNPFDQSTIIEYSLSVDDNISLTIFDLQGNILDYVLNDEYQLAGKHEFLFENSHLSKGVYLIRLKTSNQVQVQKIVVE